jgi:hypothetical protein
MRSIIAVLLCVLLAAPGCATARGTSGPSAPVERQNPDVFADYLRRLPPGSPVRLDLAGRKGMRGVVLQVTGSSVFIQARTRLPEPPHEVPLASVLRVTPDTQERSTFGKAILASAAAGAGAALAVFYILVAIYAD